MGARYCWREDVRAATDSKTTARDDPLIDRAIDAGAEAVQGLCHRTFEPVLATRFFDWPNAQYARPWRLWLDANELISLSALTSGGVTIPVGNVNLEPNQYGPPFDRIELDIGTSAAFSGGPTHQQNIGVTGLFGYRNAEAPAGALAAALADGVGTTVDVTDGSLVGVWAVLRCEAERMIVTGRQAITTGVTLGGDGLLADASDSLLEANVGFVGEVLLVDTERLLVVDVAGANRVVKRAWDGSVLAAHAPAATIFASRRLTVLRGQLGTTGVAHGNGTALQTWQPPALVRELNTAEAVAELQQHLAGWGRTVGTGENEREARGVGLADIRRRCRTAHGRQARTRAV